jgi:hypothetical protein
LEQQFPPSNWMEVAEPSESFPHTFEWEDICIWEGERGEVVAIEDNESISAGVEARGRQTVQLRLLLEFNTSRSQANPVIPELVGSPTGPESKDILLRMKGKHEATPADKRFEPMVADNLQASCIVAMDFSTIIR